MSKKSKSIAERIALRPVVLPGDEEFLIALYYTTREDIHLAPIDEEQKKMLSLMQYVAQKEYYTEQFPGSEHDIILFDGKIAGRLWTARYETEIVGVDLAIMPEFRNYKIGTKLLSDLFIETAETKRVFNLHVLKTNTKAIRLYDRLNCKRTGETITHFKMQWKPGNEILGRTGK